MISKSFSLFHGNCLPMYFNGWNHAYVIWDFSWKLIKWMINYFQIPMIMFRYSILYWNQQKRAWIWNKYCSPLVNNEAPWFLHDYAYVDVILMTCKSGMMIPYRIRHVIDFTWERWMPKEGVWDTRAHRWKNVSADTKYCYQSKWSCVLDFMSFPKVRL